MAPCQKMGAFGALMSGAYGAKIGAYFTLKNVDAYGTNVGALGAIEGGGAYYAISEDEQGANIGTYYTLNTIVAYATSMGDYRTIKRDDYGAKKGTYYALKTISIGEGTNGTM